MVIKTLKELSGLPDEKSLRQRIRCNYTLGLVARGPEQGRGILIPGIPDEGPEFDAFDRWTAGLLRKAAEVYAAAARMTVEALLYKCISAAYRQSTEADEEEGDLVERARRWKLLLERENRTRMLLEPEILDKVARYESSLERSFFRTLHEIQRLRASRTGMVVPPAAAIDVDMTVHPKGLS